METIQWTLNDVNGDGSILLLSGLQTRLILSVSQNGARLKPGGI